MARLPRRAPETASPRLGYDQPMSAQPRSRTTEITTVAFDLGGVLIDWNPRHLYRKLFGADEAAMEQFLADVCTLEWNGNFDSGRPFAEGVAELAAAHPDQADLILAYHLRWEEMLGQAYEETVAVMREVKRAGLRTYALSNWSAETFPKTRPRYPFLDELDGILISGEVGVRKPGPEIFRHFLERFGLTPEATVFIDDWDLNVARARELGMVAVQFVDAARLREDLRELGVPIAAG
jgi:2-haloacid dehalogenase